MTKITYMIISVLLIFSCRSYEEKSNDTDNGLTNLSKGADPSIHQDSFGNFITKFDLKSLPLILEVANENWIYMGGDPSRKKPIKIPKEKVMKFLFENSESAYRSSGGEQFYYGFQVQINEGIIGLIYYQTSIEETGIDGYRVALFDDKGNLLDRLLLAGSRGLFDVDKQLECIIEKDGSILINEILLDLDKIEDINEFEGRLKQIRYSISEKGIFDKVSETDYSKKAMTEDEERNYRIVVVTPTR